MPEPGRAARPSAPGRAPGPPEPRPSGPGRAARRDLAVRAAVRAGLLHDAEPVVAFLDLAGIAASAAALHDGSGSPKAGEPVVQDVAGPCCFAGDLVAQACPLPLLAPGDVVAIPDTGAYYFSTPMRYNSLPMPAVYGFEVGDRGAVRLTLLRRAETVADVVAETLGEPALTATR